MLDRCLTCVRGEGSSAASYHTSIDKGLQPKDLLAYYTTSFPYTARLKILPSDLAWTRPVYTTPSTVTVKQGIVIPDIIHNSNLYIDRTL